MTTRPLVSFFGGLALFSLLSTATCEANDKPSDDLVQMIVRLIGNSDREFRAAGLEYVRTSAKGAAATQVFSAQLAKVDTQAQVVLLHALADRGDPSARTPILEHLAKSQDEQVRAAAIAALGSVGGQADLPMLIKALSSSANAEQAAARQALVQLSGPAISKLIAADAKTASANVKAKLIDVLGTRRAIDEMPTLIAGSVDENPQIRTSSMNAIGQLARPDQVASILPGILKAAKGTERDNAERNVATICKKIDNEDQRATELIDAINKVPAEERDELLPLIGRVGGQKLINFVTDIANSDSPARRKIGIDALSKWPDASVADKLLDIAMKTSDKAERNRAFQGYVNVCAIRDSRSDKQRLDRMKEAMNVAKSVEEQAFVINRTKNAYDVESVRFVLPYVDQDEFAQAACLTIVEIAHHRSVRDANKDEFATALDKVIQVSKDPVVVDRAHRYKRGETWERPQK